jgi:hypothetical protein
LAKNSDQLAGFDGDNTGGVLSGLLAEEDEFDRRALWRLGSWGFAAVAAVTIAVLANQAHLGWRRDQMATIDLVQQANRLQNVAKESQNEARRLASAVDTLNNDRDRLYSRVTVLETGLDSVTGAIAKQASAPAQPVEAQPASQTPPPAVAPVAATPAPPPEKTTAAAASAPANVSAISKDTRAKPVVAPATQLMESRSIMAPPDPAAGKLIEPEKPVSPISTEPLPLIVAASPINENVEPDAVDAALPKVQRTEFGVDIGGANSVPGLRALWRGLLKSRANAPLAALQPIIVIREGRVGRGMQLRLVAGPLSDAAAAARLCAVLSENDRSCETAVYDGQRLAMKADEVPAAATPVTPQRKKNGQKRAAVEEPKKPAQGSGWSSFISKKLGQ